MKTNKILLKLGLSFSILSYALLAQDGSKITADGKSTENPGFEEVLLDFNQLSDDKTKTDPKIMGLHPDYWDVQLNESSNYQASRSLTYGKKINLPTTQNQGVFLNKGTTGGILGVRGHFPDVDANSYLKVKPNAYINPYDSDIFNNKGVIHNVSAIKSISSFVFGSNYDYTFSIQLKDETNALHKFFLGSLKYLGWKELKYTNASYLYDVRDRRIKGKPFYPHQDPYFVFDSYIIFRHTGEAIGDFITYVSWTKMVFDKYQVPNDNYDINHESNWGIEQYKAKQFSDRSIAKNKEMNDLINMERKRMNLPPLQTNATATKGKVAPAGQ